MHYYSAYKPWRVALLVFGTSLILAHNVLFHSIVLPRFAEETWRANFDRVQAVRSLGELLMLALLFFLAGSKRSAWFGPPFRLHTAWKASLAALGFLTIYVLFSLVPLPFDPPPSGTWGQSTHVSLRSEALPYLLLNSVALAALREELFFRGWIWQLLREKAALSPWLAVVLSSLLFSLSHWPIYGLLELSYLFGSGCLLATIRSAYGLGVCLFVHVWLNGLALATSEGPGSLGSWLAAHPLLRTLLLLLILSFFFHGLLEAWHDWRAKRSPPIR